MRKSWMILPVWALLLGALLIAPQATPAKMAGTAELAKKFATPPPEARPWVYWFWSCGNISREGITADLEAMARVGIGGVLIMEVDQGVPAGPVTYLSPQWRELFKHTVAEASRLGIEINMNNDGGWCGSGGPWIKPAQSMQVVTWSELTLNGPRAFSGPLPKPQATQNYYEDIAVLAYPVPAAEKVRMADCSPKLTIGQGGAGMDVSQLIDGSPETALSLPVTDPKVPQFIQIEFPKPFTASSLTITIKDLEGWMMAHNGQLQVSEDGKSFRTIRELYIPWPSASLDFSPVSARFFRIVFPLTPQTGYRQLAPAEIELSQAPRIEDVAAKGGAIADPARANLHGTTVPLEAAIDRGRILNLTSKMDKSGRLAWDVPAGRWTVLRLGHTTTAKMNHPAPPASLGLECDKLSKKAIETHFDGLIGRLLKESPGSQAFKTTHIDSWEVGSQNWSPLFRKDFKKLRGYDPLPLLPILTGRAIASHDASERFLWDMRRTIADLINDNYAGHMEKISQKHGLKLSIEAYGNAVVDTLAYAGRADVPMGEFWVSGGCVYLCKGMASAGHVYGKPVIGAEAFTTEASLGKWQNHPFSLKPLGDKLFCEGINRFVFHRYAHQPWLDVKPGMTMGPWGTHYERTETWWEQSKPWHEYLARCQYLLQSGQFIADLAYFYGEQSPNELPAREALNPALPAGYDFDGVPAEAVIGRMSVKDGRLVVKGGMIYRALVLPQTDTMTPALLSKIKALVKAGATVVGPRPERSPSLDNYPKCDDEIRRLAGELWGDCNGTTIKEHAYGKGKVVWGKPLDEVLSGLGVAPDFQARKAAGTPDLRFIHRKIEGMDVYFVSNPSGWSGEVNCAFRATGRPELWWPDSGRTQSVAVYEQAGGLTRLPVPFEPSGSVFVVFRPEDKAAASAPVVAVTQGGKTILSAEGPAEAIQTAAVKTPPPNITGTFTMALWAKPGADTVLSLKETTSGLTAMIPGMNDAIYPAPGHEAYGKADQACAGVDVGRNGVCVLEHGDSYYAPVLVQKAQIGDWTHVAVIYKDGTPSLYLNGKLARQGLKSGMVMHPSLGVQHTRPVNPFVGGTFAPKQFDRALSEAELAQLMADTRPDPTTIIASGPAIERVETDGDGYKVLAWEAGAYELKTGAGRSLGLTVPALPTPLEVKGSWTVRFAKGWGAPEETVFEKLVSWPEHKDQGIKYFSGTATYRKSVTVPAEMLGTGRRLYLDLGGVQVIAEVKLNGKELGTLWKPPFRLDVTEAARTGENELEVRVTNLWPNRLIGDEQLPDDCEWITPAEQGYGSLKAWPAWMTEHTLRTSGRRTFATWKHFLKDSPLMDSGLLGPVTLRAGQEVSVRP